MTGRDAVIAHLKTRLWDIIKKNICESQGDTPFGLPVPSLWPLWLRSPEDTAWDPGLPTGHEGQGPGATLSSKTTGGQRVHDTYQRQTKTGHF